MHNVVFGSIVSNVKSAEILLILFRLKSYQFSFRAT